MSKRAPIGAYDRALKLLTIRDHAEVELRRKLRRAQHPPEEIDRAIERVRALGYLDDARFAASRARALVVEGRNGPRAVALKLRQAGVDEATVRSAVEHAMEGQDQVAVARALIEKKHPDALRGDDPKAKARAARFLASRGFGSDVVYKVLRLSEE
jgi:regulatory protein